MIGDSVMFAFRQAYFSPFAERFGLFASIASWISVAVTALLMLCIMLTIH